MGVEGAVSKNYSPGTSVSTRFSGHVQTLDHPKSSRFISQGDYRSAALPAAHTTEPGVLDSGQTLFHNSASDEAIAGIGARDTVPS